jgi:hypothetical protein
MVDAVARHRDYVAEQTLADEIRLSVAEVPSVTVRRAG